MNLSIFGMGYVGCVSAACFADAGHHITGVDVSAVKTEAINAGRCPIVEPGADNLIRRHVAAGRLQATTDHLVAILETDITLVCVGTPGKDNGSLDLSYIIGACNQIGTALRSKGSFHVVVMRSTMLPGTIYETVVPTLEAASGKKNGVDFAVAINPEFLREGTAIADFYSPPFTLIGADHVSAVEALTKLYSIVDAPIYNTTVREAEMVKYACNCFHALKVSFANEIGVISKAVGIDSHRVMEVFCKDDKLNLSPYYLKPGFAFGGSCLPKDLRAICYKAKDLDLDTPVLRAALESNDLHVERVVDQIIRTGKKSVSMLGLSFKAGTDDLRESPMVLLAERLIGKGIKLSIYDREVSLARLLGANKAYIEGEIPHISSLLKDDLEEVVLASELVVVCKKDPDYADALLRRKSAFLTLDLARIDSIRGMADYTGVCW
jgi:GDP-mannose 6-dehydrogenase